MKGASESFDCLLFVRLSRVLFFDICDSGTVPKGNIYLSLKFSSKLHQETVCGPTNPMENTSEQGIEKFEAPSLQKTHMRKWFCTGPNQLELFRLSPRQEEFML